MVQSNSAPREPSMEEILASIRRIIEDSDSSRKATEDAAPPTAGTVSAESSNVHAFRLGLHDQHETPQAAAPAAGSANGGLRWNDWETPAEPAQENGPATAGDAEKAGTAMPSSAGEIEMDLDLDEFADRRAEGAEADAPEAAGQPPAIISDHAGRQVAASFGELSAALEARSRKSFDQIAEEMMRPMLQDWLDNNLPHLVERLVREEIERIARGSASQR